MQSPLQVLLVTAASSLILGLFTVGLFFAGVFTARRLGYSPTYSLSSLGFSRPGGGMGAVGGAGLGFLIGLGAVFVGGIISAATALILTRLGYPADNSAQQPFMDSLRSWVETNPTLAVPAIISVVVIIGPACEELAFRGGIFNGLNNLGRFLYGTLSRGDTPAKLSSLGAPAVLAAVLSSVFFALLHLSPVILPSLFVFALVLCYLFQKTGSLIPCFVAHATFNSFATGVIILTGLGVAPTLPT